MSGRYDDESSLSTNLRDAVVFMLDERLRDLTQEVSGLIPTKNNRGFMMTELSQTSKEYIAFAKDCAHVLDIGCAYGISVLPVLDYLKPRVHVVDLCAAHIDVLRAKIGVEQLPYFSAEIAEFPVHTQFRANTFDAIHISHVLHFIRGEHFTYALSECFKWLKPDGRLFLTMSSLYFPYFIDFIPTYEERKRQGYLFAGEIEDMRIYVPNHLPDVIKANQPKYLHVFTKEDLEGKLFDAGFEIDQSDYFTLEDAPYLKYVNDSRACIGIIARKPVL
ncbi:methyltransferase domain-containing protein [Cysteiniphilum litorale]|uniref:class I SAM-dependent methyltransferase n=1 Tax=Cysteiniphilum litorale TaxID=2056700 RepID=UPI003F885A88